MDCKDTLFGGFLSVFPLSFFLFLFLCLFLKMGYVKVQTSFERKLFDVLFKALRCLKIIPLEFERKCICVLKRNWF